MVHLEHFNFGWLHKPPLPPACCHCLVVRSLSGVILIDTGIGMHDIADPAARIGNDVIESAGFKFIPEVTAFQQLKSLGIRAPEVTDIVLTHCDTDHVGGLADFPNARVHVAVEEKANLDSGNPRYTPRQFSHGPHWHIYSDNDCSTFGLPSRRVNTVAEAEIRLIPLFGHTNGHCGVAAYDCNSWTLHVGDAYYLRDELTNREHPINELASFRADNNDLRLESLDKLRHLTQQGDINLTYFGYHDIAELPSWIPINP